MWWVEWWSFRETQRPTHKLLLNIGFLIGEPPKSSGGNGAQPAGRRRVRISVDSGNNSHPEEVALWVMHFAYGRDENPIRMCRRFGTDQEVAFHRKAKQTWSPEEKASRFAAHGGATAIALTHRHGLQHSREREHSICAPKQMSLQRKRSADGVKKTNRKQWSHSSKEHWSRR